MKNAIIIAVTLSAVITLCSCGGNSNGESIKEKPQEDSSVMRTTENSTTLTEEQVKTIGIKFGVIEQKALTNSIKANGILTVPNQNKAFVTPLYSGVVKSLHVQPGSFVKQGQAIAAIVNPDLLAMQQQLQQLNTQISLSEIEVNRQKELVEGNAAPLKKLQQVQTELETLKSQRNGLQQQLSAFGASEHFSSSIIVKAPISGTISKVITQLGSNVSVSTPIAEIVNNSQLHLDLFVYEKDLPKLKANQTIHFTLTNNPGKEYDATIYSIGTAFEPDSKTIPVHAKVMGDKAGLIDGMNITALVSLDNSTVPAVPTDAIVTYQGQDYVFVLSNQNKEKKDSNQMVFERVPVARGTTDVGYTEVTLLKGVPENAKVVVYGSYFILAKMTNTEHEE